MGGTTCKPSAAPHGRQAARTLHAGSSYGADNSDGQNLLERSEIAAVQEAPYREAGKHGNGCRTDLRIGQLLGALPAVARKHECGARPKDAGHGMEYQQNDQQELHGRASPQGSGTRGL